MPEEYPNFVRKYPFSATLFPEEELTEILHTLSLLWCAVGLDQKTIGFHYEDTWEVCVTQGEASGTLPHGIWKIRYIRENE